MAANIENEQLMRKAMKLLHSSHPNSAAELRLMIDEIIKQRYGPEKTLTSTMGKRLLEEEANFPGRAVTPPPQPEPMQTDAEEVINLTNSPPKTISDSPDTIIDSDDAMSNTGAAMGTATGLSIITNVEDDGNLKEFGDLNCCVCGDMMFTATNRLIECSKCGSLFHQECHKPPIPDEEATEDQQHSWQCDNCLNKPSTSKAAAAAALVGNDAAPIAGTGVILSTEEPIPLIAKSKSSSSSSSSSNSSSPFYKQELPSSSTSTKSNQKSSSTSKSSREERPSKSNTASTSALNIISSTEKSSTTHSSSKKSSSHSSSSKSSSSKSSKHHDSKRKSSK